MMSHPKFFLKGRVYDYKEGLVTPHYLLQLLLSVGAIAVMRDGGYLMPALLRHLASEKVFKYSVC